MLRALLLGYDGMVGQAFDRLLRREPEVEHEPLDQSDIDFAEPASLERFSADGVDVVINCAAYTDVDGAEQAEELATKVNGTSMETIARRCREAGATLIHFSTDYVFDGRGTAPYPVDAPIAPLNAYGRSKAVGEAAIRDSAVEHLLVRTSWVYAPWGKNFVRTMARLTADKDALRVVDDQRGRPTSAEHLVRTTWDLYANQARGAFHVTDGGECTWYELAKTVRDEVGATCAIEPCTTEEFPRPAVRPAYSVLDLSRAEDVVGPMPHWRTNVAEVVRRLES